ncbi:MAG: nitroreductase/quinone reductase family protein [Acidimicrobiales bacterium]
MRRILNGFNRRFTRFHTRVYLRTGGWLGHRMTGPVPSLLLHSTGRKSGLRRSVALAYAPADGSYLVVASNFGGDQPPGWLANVRANPRASIHVGRHCRPITADVILPGDPDYERLFRVADENNRGRYSRYRTMTDRPIPVVRLLPDIEA